MNLFRIEGQKLIPINETSFSLEVEMQRITEANLKTIFGLELVKSEYQLENYSFDTLAFNPETKAFEIIEYKKKEEKSIVEQGIAYFRVLSERQKEVLWDYNELKNSNLKLKDIAWNKTRIKFIAPEFTPYQKRALSAESSFELYIVRKYGSTIIGYEQVQPNFVSRTIQQVSSLSKKKIEVSTPKDFIDKVPPSLKDVVRTIEEKTLDLGSDVEATAGQICLSFRTKKKTFLQIWLIKDHFTVTFPDGYKLTDNKNLLKGRGKKGKFIIVSSKDRITEIEDYIRQAYQISL